MHQLPAKFPPPEDVPFIKVCGLTRAQDAVLALELGAAFLGLIFAESSPRRVTLEAASRLVSDVRKNHKGPDPPRFVGVFVSESVADINTATRELGLQAVQLHGLRDEYELAQIEAPILQAVRVKGPQSAVEIEDVMRRHPVLLDTFVEGKHGGTGKVFDHELAIPHIARGPVFIAGGLNPENVGEIVRRFRHLGAMPYALDVSSGLEERPGIKDPDKLERFFSKFSSALAGK